MSRTLGTVVRGVRAPIFREGDDVVAITADTVVNALSEEGIQPRDKDIVAITESVVARCQGNYASVQQIAADVKTKTGSKTVGVSFPILSRNRFSLLLSGIASGAEKVVLLLSLPSDEVGNHLVSMEQLDEAGVDPYRDVLTLAQFRSHFGSVIHPFTGVDYVDYYQSLIEAAGAQAEIVFSNRVESILDYTDTILCCDIHTRRRSKAKLRAAGAKCVLGLDDLLTSSVNGSGYNPQYGLLGSNKADEERVKLFPRDTMAVAEALGAALSQRTGKHIEAMIYGDGAFKDPAGKIWELADPVVSPGYTAGLEGTPNELKLKYLADKDFADLSGEALQKAISEKIRQKDAKTSLVGNMISEGTTPRRLTDLIGSLCDLTSGSGDKGTPIVYIQGYFDNYTTD
ncbi:MAG: coenzyme F420-0:L-glutamate ligase [Clostridiales bacterium]|nr:coenzyme F420-0:L-glutamate ligase [Clostridiales bacterium]